MGRRGKCFGERLVSAEGAAQGEGPLGECEAGARETAQVTSKRECRGPDLRCHPLPHRLRPLPVAQPLAAGDEGADSHNVSLRQGQGRGAGEEVTWISMRQHSSWQDS